jgi:asparagine synthase (glutamine-hydrolysing)
MCRIAGIIADTFTINEAEAKVRVMCNVMQHGGPDDEGFYSDAQTGLVFGHRRLSVIDLSKNGHQPMADIHQKAWITFNGEIYNYRELKQELISIGAVFTSGTDTEVILQAYLHWGVSSFTKLRGMFAFALYDVKEKNTYLVRDTTGIKPLYYYAHKDQLSFASEVKALSKAGIANFTDPNWQVRFLAFGHIPEPYTTLHNVYSLPKGHYLQWQHSSSTYTIKSFTASPTANTDTSGEATEKIYRILNDAIERQLIADASIGVFLSGGIDSSIIALLANQFKQEHLKTVSVYFNNKSFDERAYQNQVAAQLKGEKYTHLVTQADFELNFDTILNAADMPTTDGINTWFISKFAREAGLKAVLSGLGADELFGGYPSFNRIAHIKQLRKLPAAIYKLAAGLPVDKYRKIAFLKKDHPVADYLFLRGLFIPEDIATILDIDEKQVADILFTTDVEQPPQTYDEQHAAWLETNLYMQNQLLRDTDVMSMNHGLEVRVPFLDEDVQAVVNTIAADTRFDKHQPKKLLVNSFKNILPREVWDRPKVGFSFPLQQWMAGNKAIVDEGVYKGKEAKRVIRKFKNNKLHWSKAYALYQLQNA